MKTKSQIKSQLEQLKNKYIITIYAGLSSSESIRDIHKKILNDTLTQKKKGEAVNDAMMKQAMSAVKVLRKKIGSKTYNAGGDNIPEGEILSIMVFDLLNKNKLEKKLSHQITKEADAVEGKTKDEVVKDNISKNRGLENPRIFYLASWHKDSASDHAPYQGKIYVDEKWRNVIQDKDKQKEVQNYLTGNSIQTIQWVVGKPVWFVTRPNCRHYFKELGVEDVLKTSVSNLLKEHKMETALGDREYLQTIKHSTSKEWYNVRNAELVLEKYKQRLALHQDMWKANPNAILKSAIKKDLLLVRKWQNYILERKSEIFYISK